MTAGDDKVEYRIEFTIQRRGADDDDFVDVGVRFVRGVAQLRRRELRHDDGDPSVVSGKPNPECRPLRTSEPPSRGTVGLRARAKLSTVLVPWRPDVGMEVIVR